MGSEMCIRDRAKYYARTSKGIVLSIGRSVPEAVEVVPSPRAVSPQVIEIRTVAAFTIGVCLGIGLARSKRQRKKR